MIRTFILGSLFMLLSGETFSQTDSLSLSLKLLHENQTSKVRKKLKQAQSAISLNSLKQELVNPKQDTLPKTLTKLDTTKLEIDSLKRTAQHNLDSIKGIGNQVKSKIGQIENIASSPVTYINGKVGSLGREITQPLDSLHNAISSSMKDLRDSISGRVDSLTNIVNSTIGKFSEATGIQMEKIELPGMKMKEGEMKLSAGQEIIPGLKMPGVDGETLMPKDLMPKDLPKMNEIKGLEEVNKIGKEAAELKDLPKQKMQELPGVEKFNQVNSKISKLDGQLEKVEKLEGDAKKLAEGKIGEMEQLPEEIEKRAVQLASAEAKELTTHTEKIKQYEALRQKYKDKKLLQQEMNTTAICQARINSIFALDSIGRWGRRPGSMGEG